MVVNQVCQKKLPEKLSNNTLRAQIPYSKFDL